MSVLILIGDVLERIAEIADASVHCVVTSPPYWGLRDYGTATWEGGDAECDHVEVWNSGANTRLGLAKAAEKCDGVLRDQTARRDQGVKHYGRQYGDVCAKCGARRVDSQLGLEATPEEHVERMVAVFREVRRVLRGDGVCFINYGDSYFSADAVRRDAQGNDTGGKESRDSLERGSAYPDLCDGCSAALSSRSENKILLTRGALQLGENEDRHTDASGLGLGENAASPPDVRASTKLESSRPLPKSCSHCTNCGACLSVLRSSSRDARLCARKVLYRRDTASSASVSRTQSKDASDSAWGYSTMADLKSKDLVGMPWRVAFGLQADGWYLRSDIIWAKPNPMPESVTDRPTKSHEHVFLLAKSQKYFYDADAVREGDTYRLRKAGHKAALLTDEIDGLHRTKKGFATHDTETIGRNLRDVWTIATHPYSAAHFATFPPKLVEPCIKAGTSEEGCCSICGAPFSRVIESTDATNDENVVIDHAGVPGLTSGSSHDRVRSLSGATYKHVKRGTNRFVLSCQHVNASTIPCTVLDPFGGAGTVGLVADQLQRNAILIELNDEYARMAERRIRDDCPMFTRVETSEAENGNE